MTDLPRAYRHERDYERIGRFLVDTYQAERQPANWFQPRWEYMHYLVVPFNGTPREHLERIGVWERAGEITGVVHFEDAPGYVYVELHPEHPELKDAMVDHAERHLTVTRPDGSRWLRVHVSDWDGELESLLETRGYVRNDRGGEALTRLSASDLAGPPALPPGYRLQSVADGIDPDGLVRVLHRGFNHPGEPPARSAAALRSMLSAPGFRPELAIVAVAPGGEYASYASVWYEPINRYAMVEPVATDPDHRRIGLATAVVSVAIRRAGELGATVAYVGTDKPVYLAMGFRPMSRYAAWERTWTA